MPGLIQVHPSERLVAPGGDEIDIDVEMVPLIRRLWAMGLETRGCCQDFGDSIINNGHRSTSPADARQRFADFYKDQAWLKMPIDSATHLIELLGNDPTFARRVQSWTHPEAWMNIVYIHPDEKGRAGLNRSAQLHFPKSQLPELIEALREV